MKNKLQGKIYRLKAKIVAVAMLLTFCSSLSTVMSQEAIPAAGGEASGSGGRVSYTAGQIFYHTFEGVTGTVAEGVQQPYEVYVVSVIDEVAGTVSAFPNPVSDLLKVKVEKEMLKNLDFQLFDMSGRLIESRKVISEITEIKMYGLKPGVYFLKVIDNEKKIKSFKIVKR